MAFIRQTWTLTKKNLLIVLGRHWFSTTVRAFLAPIIFMFFISYAKNFFVPPSDFGVGSPIPLRSLADALGASVGGRNTVAFINNGHVGGEIGNVISNLTSIVQSRGMTAVTLDDDTALLDICRSSVRGVTPCFAAVNFHTSPSEGGSIWNYTIRADGSLGEKVYVGHNNNDVQVYLLPLQHAIDAAIAAGNGTTLSLPDQIIYTNQNNEERDRTVTRLYMGTLISILGVAYFIGVVGICYQLTGQMAIEREIGMSSLIESMMPNPTRWQPQAARIISTHLAFDMLYFPSWVIMAVIDAKLNYTFSNTGIVVGYFIVAGLALSSWSVAFASLFRKAQLSGITVTIVSIVLAIIVQVQTPESTGGVAILSLVFPPMNFVMFIIYMAYWQQQNLPADLSQGPPRAPWHLPGYVFFIFCIIQFLAYPIIGALIERGLYGTASKARRMQFTTESTDETVTIHGLGKQYVPGWFHRKIASRFMKSKRDTVVAVDDLNLKIRHGEIHVLLGANGSGKSTTMDMLAGLQTPTSGSIDINANGVGLCPQKNVLWDVLTCEEHVRIFNQLKTLNPKQRDTDEGHIDLLSSCDLAHKIEARSATLSGGQKRKLQLAMMLTGDSGVCLLDEVSSGLDPLSRRKIWDILLAERGRRSMLFTTHFLDEADLLSDQITILSKGRKVAEGSAVALKHELGGGYRVKIYTDKHFEQPKEWADTPKRVHTDHVVFNLTDSLAAAKFVTQLEQLGIHDYRVSGPTVEDVFLKLASEVMEDSTLTDDAALNTVTSIQSGEKGLELAKGRRLSAIAQAWVLFRKRFTILRRNKLPYIAAVLIPIVTAGLVTLFLDGFEALSCSPGASVSVSDVVSLASYTRVPHVPYGPQGSVPITALDELYPYLGDHFDPVDSEDDLQAYIKANYSRAYPGGFFVNATGTSLFAYQGNTDMSLSISTLNLLDVSLLGTPIATSYQEFDSPWAPSAGKSLQFILYFGLAMCAYPGFFALYPTSERLNKIRALHWSNGIRALPLWAAYTAYDFVFVLIISVVAIAMFTGVSSALYAPGYLFVVFFLYGLAALLSSYVVSLFVTSQLAAFAFAAGMQCSFFLIYFVAYMCILTYAPTASIDNWINIAHFTISLVTPSGNLLRSLLLTFNNFSILCRGREIVSYPGGILVYGGPILYLLAQSALLLLFLVTYESGWRPGFISRISNKGKEVEESESVDEDVHSEALRVEDCKDELRVSHVSKVFGDNRAVDDVSFGVPRGEIFALLGPNGAGKSTTIGLVRGDVPPTGNGDVFVEDTSIVHHRAAARLHEGVCPQFDAMDAMTAEEHLYFYARARGVSDVKHNVEKVMQAVGLTPFRTRMASKLSGGNKRKLSLGIALIGNPTVLLVDEGSSGMDAAAKRIMWRTLNAVSAGRSLVLTTHSMEEADALADRVGIMARRMLALGTADSLRSKHGDAYYVHLVHRDAPHTSQSDMAAIQSWIRENFPAAEIEDRSFHGQIRFRVPNRVSSPSTDLESVYSKDSSTKKTSVAVVAPVDVTNTRSGISALFEKLEGSKEKLGMEFYAVSQATLDQVFLSIVQKHNVQEENYQREHPATLGAWGKFKRGCVKAYHDA